MLRALWFAVKVGALVFAAVWLANRPGTVRLHWLDYDVSAQLGFVFLLLFIALLILLILHRSYLGVLGFGRTWRYYNEQKRQSKGYRALALGLSAVAAGDAKLAAYQAHRMRKLLPDDRGLPYLLEAQAARMKGDLKTANEKFEKLVENEDTAFLGLRGLMLTAAEQGDMAQALAIARQAQKKHRKQPWILNTLYDLELRNEAWDEALKTLTLRQRLKQVNKEAAHADRAAIFLQQARLAQERGAERKALSYLRKAQRTAPEFLPSGLALAYYYADHNKRRAAIATVEKIWKFSPHPELVLLWTRLMPKKKRRTDLGSRVQWFERLVALKPDSAEGQLAAAAAMIEESLWGEARQYLQMAEKLQPSPRLYKLWAHMEERLGHTEAANALLEKATEAPAERVWTCRETGRIYERWSPVAAPHGSFNTIIWDYPRAALPVPAAGGFLDDSGGELLSTGLRLR